MALLRHTNIIIVARSVRRDGRRSIVVLPVTLNVSIGLFVMFINLALAAFTTADMLVGPLARLALDIYRTLFTGWSDEWPFIWLAIKSLFVEVEYGLG